MYMNGRSRLRRNLVTLWFVQNTIGNFFEVFTLKHDNNYHAEHDDDGHVWGPVCRVSIIGSQRSWYRSWRSGSPGGSRSETADSLPVCMAWILVGASYLMILYSTEARGYSYLICLAYLSWLFLLRAEANGRWTDAAGFAISASLWFSRTFDISVLKLCGFASGLCGNSKEALLSNC